MQQQIAGWQRRAARYSLEDGVFELHQAYWMLIFGVYSWAVWAAPAWQAPLAAFARWHGPLWTVLVAFVVPVAVPLSIAQLGLHLVQTHLRPRWLRRTDGVVHAKPWLVPRWALAGGYGLTALLSVGGVWLAAATQNPRWLLVGLYTGAGLSQAWMLAISGTRVGLPRIVWLALGGAAVTLVLALLPLRAGIIPALICFSWALLLATSGTWAMLTTARAQQRPTQVGHAT